MITRYTLSPSATADVLHVVALGTTAYTLRAVFARVDHPAHNAYGSHFQYLTIIALVLTIETFLAALAHAAWPFKGSAVLDRLYRCLRCVAAPLELLIASSYWTLYFINPGLLAEQRSRPTLGLDVALHLLPAVFLLLDFFAVPRKRHLTIDSRLAHLGFGMFIGAYVLWLSQCRRRNGYWAYPVLEGLGWELMSVLFAGTVLALSGTRQALLSWTVTV